jgi:hypothetical protein
MWLNKETAIIAIGILGLLGGVLAFGNVWYSRTYKPGAIAGRTLMTVASSLRNTKSDWTQTSDVSVRECWNPFAVSDTRVGLFVQGTWKGASVRIQFKLDMGAPDSSYWGNGEAGLYHPPVTSIRLTSNQFLAGNAGLVRSSSSILFANKVVAPLGMAPRLKRISEDLFAYGEEAELARFFNSNVLALVRSFPRDLFGPSFQGPVIEGSEITMSWEGHETDPKVIEAAFHLLTTISEAAVAAK